MIAVSLNVRQNCTCARKTLQTQRGRTHVAGCVRQWFRPLSHSGNVVTRIGMFLASGRTHGYGYVPLRFGGGGRRWENGNTTTLSGEIVRNLLLPAETVHGKWLPAETVRVILNRTNCLCRKLFTKHNSLGRKQEIADSLGGSQI